MVCTNDCRTINMHTVGGHVARHDQSAATHCLNHLGLFQSGGDDIAEGRVLEAASTGMQQLHFSLR